MKKKYQWIFHIDVSLLEGNYPKWAFIRLGEVEKDDSPSQGSRKHGDNKWTQFEGKDSNLGTFRWFEHEGKQDHSFEAQVHRFWTMHMPFLRPFKLTTPIAWVHWMNNKDIHVSLCFTVWEPWILKPGFTMASPNRHRHSAEAIFRDSWEKRSQNGGFHIWSSGKLGAGWWGVANGVKWRLENDSIRCWFFFGGWSETTHENPTHLTNHWSYTLTNLVVWNYQPAICTDFARTMDWATFCFGFRACHFAIELLVELCGKRDRTPEFIYVLPDRIVMRALLAFRFLGCWVDSCIFKYFLHFLDNWLQAAG